MLDARKELSNICDLLAGIAVLATMINLAMQIRQTTAALRSTVFRTTATQKEAKRLPLEKVTDTYKRLQTLYGDALQKLIEFFAVIWISNIGEQV